MIQLSVLVHPVAFFSYNVSVIKAALIDAYEIYLAVNPLDNLSYLLLVSVEASTIYIHLIMNQSAI